MIEKRRKNRKFSLVEEFLDFIYENRERDGFIFIYLFGSLKSVFGIVIYIEFILLL